MRINLAVAAILLLLYCLQCDGAKILALFAYPAKSHSIMLNTVLKGLLARGHELTVVTNYPLPENTPNYTYIDISPPIDRWGLLKNKFNATSPFVMHSIPSHKLNEFFVEMRLATTEHLLRHPNVQNRLFHPPRPLTFDLVLVEEFYQEALLAFGHQFGAPLLSIASFDFAQHFDEMFGNFGAWSHVPHEYVTFGERMTFVERIQNVRIGMRDWYERHYLYMPEQQLLLDKYFALLPEPRPTVEQLYYNVSMLLVNGHQPLTSIRPNVPAIIDVGGLHIDTVSNPLPANIRTFLDTAPAGVIYFSFGSSLRSSDMPSAQFNAFVRTFELFAPVRFLWKLEDTTTAVAASLPPNVLAQSWLPQNDVLAHPNVQVFITHGGLLGIQEAIYHAVPMLGIPVFADQPRNVARAQRDGYAVGLQFDNVTEASLRWALDELLLQNRERYVKHVQRMSRIFRDRPETPLERAMYWIEYVIRHRGAQHLRSEALDMNWFRYMLLDVVASVVVFGCILLIALWLIGKRIVALVRKCFWQLPKDRTCKKVQ